MNKVSNYERFKVWYDRKGYPKIRIAGKEVPLHVYVWEKRNGSKPKHHDVHHKNGDKSDYALRNLELVNHSAHRRIHAGWVRDRGEWTAKPCNSCKKILPLKCFYFINTRKIQTNFCKKCHNEIVKQRNSTPERRAELKIYKRNYYRAHYGKQK